MKRKSLLNKIGILSCILLLSWSHKAYSLDINRYRALPSCVLAEDLSSIEDLERKGWTVSGNPTIVDTASGKAMDLDGTGDEVIGEVSTDYQPGTNFSYGVWVKYDSNESKDYMFGRGDSETGVDNVWVMRGGWAADTNTPTCAMLDGGTWAVAEHTAALADDVWHHVACVKDGNTLRLYVNGTASATDSVTGKTFTTDDGNLYIGAGYDGGQNWYGGLKDALIFNRVLSATEISQIYNNTVFDYWQSEVSHWDMSEINPQDIGFAGNGNDGTGSGLVASTEVVYEDGDWGVEFNGSDETVSIAQDSSIDFTGKTAYSMVFKANSYSDGGGNFGKFYAKGGSNLMETREESSGAVKYKVTIDMATDATVTTTNGYGVKVPHHIAYSFNEDSDNKIKLYVDGEKVALGTDTAGVGAIWDDSSSPLYIGSNRYSMTRTFDGAIYDVRLYSNKALTMLQIEDLYVQEGRR